jgi:hypothetical protein
MSMPLPGEIRYPSTAAHREMRWEREHRAIHVSEVTHRTYRDSDGPGGVVARRAVRAPHSPRLLLYQVAFGRRLDNANE